MDKEEVRGDLEQLEDEEEIEKYLKNLWEEARQEALDTNQAWFRYRMSEGEMEIDTVIDMLDTDIKQFNTENEENETK